MVLLGPTPEEQEAWDLGDKASVQRCLRTRGYDVVPSIAPLVLPRDVRRVPLDGGPVSPHWHRPARYLSFTPTLEVLVWAM